MTEPLNFASPLKAMLIPADILKPLEFVDFHPEKVETWPELLGLPDNHVGFMTYPYQGVAFMHDDDAYLRDGELQVNMRMNLLDGQLTGRGGMRLSHMLAGDFVMTGIDAGGESVDIPQTMIDIVEDVHLKALELEMSVREAREKLRANGVIK